MALGISTKELYAVIAAVIEAKTIAIFMKVLLDTPVDFITTISESEDILERAIIMPTYKVNGSRMKPTEGIEYKTISETTSTGMVPAEALLKA